MPIPGAASSHARTHARAHTRAHGPARSQSEGDPPQKARHPHKSRSSLGPPGSTPKASSNPPFAWRVPPRGQPGPRRRRSRKLGTQTQPSCPPPWRTVAHRSPAPRPHLPPPSPTPTHLGRSGGGGPRSRCGRRQAGAASSAAGRTRGHGPRRRRAGVVPAAPFRPRSTRLRRRPLTARLGRAAQQHPPLRASPAAPPRTRTVSSEALRVPQERRRGDCETGRRSARCARTRGLAARCRGLLARKTAVAVS